MRQEYDAYMLRSEQQDMLEIAKKYIGSSYQYVEIQKIVSEMESLARPSAARSEFSLSASTDGEKYTGFKFYADRWHSPVLVGEFIESKPYIIENRQQPESGNAHFQVVNHIVKVFLYAAAMYFGLLSISIAISMGR